MEVPTKDIATRDDVENLIVRFYDKVRRDELLAPVFSHVDWEHHTPIIIEFWCMILLGYQNYKDNPFEKHIKLPINRAHFERWLQLFHRTIDENFIGEKSVEAKQRANSIAVVFQSKLGLLR